jgi:two-component system, OmpR family, sensor histidine kinase MprB
VSLRWRIALVLGLVAALVGIVAGAGAYITTARQLRSAVDETLVSRAQALDALRGGAPGRPGAPAGSRGPFAGAVVCPVAGSLQPAAGVQLVDGQGGTASCLEGGPALPVDDADRERATDPSTPALLRTVTVDGVDYRLITVGWRRGVAVQIARDLSEIDDTLSGLRLRLGALVLGGVAMATLLGWWLAGRIVRPVRRLRGAAEQIAVTQDLSTPLPTDGPGEVGSLARSLSTMVAALDASREQQQQLVADASHELRTPLTTLRTNVEHLRRANLADEEREAVLADIDLESRELTDLVNELVELATDRTASDEAVAPVRLGDLARAVAGRAERRTGRTVTVTDSGDTLVDARSRMVERAIANLVDNAVKYSPPGSPVDVVVDGTRVEVRDRGRGIATADRPKVFDRFYRATTARTEPGSGLGLAIVRQIAELHGGTVWAANRPDGAGAAVGFDLATR